MEDKGEMVRLHVYDISQGMAKMFSAALLGKQLEGIWHTGVVVYGKEFYWGGEIQEDLPGRTPYGTPTRVIDIGETFIPASVFNDFIMDIRPRYTLETYRLLSNNCNNFSQECVQFLTGKSIPSDILNLPEDALNTPMGQMLRPLIEQMENNIMQQLRTGQHEYHYPFNSPPTPSAPFFTPFSPFGMPLQPQPTATNPANTTATATQPTATTPATLSTPETLKKDASSKPTTFKHISPENKALLSNVANIPSLMQKFKNCMKFEATEESILINLEKYLSDPAKEKENPPEGTYPLLEKVPRQLPVERWFPWLCLMRLLILRSAVNAYFVQQKGILLDIFKKCIVEGVPKTVQVMAMTLATNAFSTPQGCNFMVQEAEVIIPPVLKLLQINDQIAAAVVYNYSLHLTKGSNSSVDVVLAVLALLRNKLDDETAYRLLVSLGNFVVRFKKSTESQLIKEDFYTIQAKQNQNLDKIKECTSEITSLLQDLKSNFN